MAFYDKPPFRSGMCFYCLPCTCCGPPVIFSYNPKCFCIDLTPCFGSSIQAAPCSCFNLKIGLCMCNPCYTLCSFAIMYGLKDPDVFLLKLKQARNPTAHTVDECSYSPLHSTTHGSHIVPALSPPHSTSHGSHIVSALSTLRPCALVTMACALCRPTGDDLLPEHDGYRRERARHLRLCLGQHARLWRVEGRRCRRADHGPLSWC
jgi:hypothetical protein